MRYLIYLKYIGTSYCGWQVQNNALSIQTVVQDAVEKVFCHRPDIKGCSRTDSGVHANMYCAHFDSDKEISPRSVVLGMNINLPDDVAVFDCKIVDDNFHARYSCIEKEYIYLIHHSSYRDPFVEGRAYRRYGELDVDKLNEAAQHFCGTHDFSTFCSAGAKEGDKTRTVKYASVTKEGDLVTFRVCADGFLYNMVRIMAGTLLKVAEGKINPEEIPAIIESKDRSKAGGTAPAVGLYLNEVRYSSLDE